MIFLIPTQPSQKLISKCIDSIHIFFPNEKIKVCSSDAYEILDDLKKSKFVVIAKTESTIDANAYNDATMFSIYGAKLLNKQIRYFVMRFDGSYELSINIKNKTKGDKNNDEVKKEKDCK